VGFRNPSGSAHLLTATMRERSHFFGCAHIPATYLTDTSTTKCRGIALRYFASELNGLKEGSEKCLGYWSTQDCVAENRRYGGRMGRITFSFQAQKRDYRIICVYMCVCTSVFSHMNM